jgi:YVTN family beta-propeller protein
MGRLFFIRKIFGLRGFCLYLLLNKPNVKISEAASAWIHFASLAFGQTNSLAGAILCAPNKSPFFVEMLMKNSLLVFSLLLFPSLLSAQNLLVANQGDHTLLVIDTASRKTLATVGVDINGHEVIASPDGKFAYVPIYGNSGVGKPGTDGSTVEVIEIASGRAVHIIDLGKPARPHCAKFGPDGMLYVSAELAKAVDVIDPRTLKVVAEIPTGQVDSHMFVITPDGARAYTANVFAGSVSVLDLRGHSLITKIPVAGEVQRISISPDGRTVYTHDQQKPRIALIDASKNAVSTWWDVPDIVYSSASSPDGHWLVANGLSGKLFVLDTSSGKVAHSYDIPASSGETIVAPDNSRAYVSCPQAGVIEVLNLRTWELEKPIQLTKGADGVAFASTASAVAQAQK